MKCMACSPSHPARHTVSSSAGTRRKLARPLTWVYLANALEPLHPGCHLGARRRSIHVVHRSPVQSHGPRCYVIVGHRSCPASRSYCQSLASSAPEWHAFEGRRALHASPRAGRHYCRVSCGSADALPRGQQMIVRHGCGPGKMADGQRVLGRDMIAAAV